MMSRYGGHRIPDEYTKDWDKQSSLGEWWEWWHLGYEDGVWKTKYEYGISDETVEEDKQSITELERLQKENDSLRGLLAANVRVIKEELRKEMEVEKESQP